MKLPTAFQILLISLAAFILFTSVTAIAATNTVPDTRLELDSMSLNLNDLKPSSCAGLFVTNLVTGSGTLTGTNGDDLILGSSSIDTIDGLGGNDCIVGGGGDDLLTGGDGNDICIGGPGTDTFTTCEGESQ